MEWGTLPFGSGPWGSGLAGLADVYRRVAEKIGLMLPATLAVSFGSPSSTSSLATQLIGPPVRFRAPAAINISGRAVEPSTISLSSNPATIGVKTPETLTTAQSVVVPRTISVGPSITGVRVVPVAAATVTIPQNRVEEIVTPLTRE